jgi:hypothetical protein
VFLFIPTWFNPDTVFCSNHARKGVSVFFFFSSSCLHSVAAAREQTLAYLLLLATIHHWEHIPGLFTL